MEPPPEPEPEPEPDTKPGEPTEPQEPPSEPEPEQETQARMEEIGKKLDGLQKHVAKRLGDILGDDATLYVPCELCTPWQTPGFRPPLEPPPEVAAALWHLLGQHSPTDYQADTHSTVCSRCAGFGEVATGSKVQGQTQLPCVECKGLGWTPTDDARAPGFGTVANGPTPLYPPPSYEASALPAPDEPDPPEVAALKAQGYTVIRPFVPTGQMSAYPPIDTLCRIVVAVCLVVLTIHLTQMVGIVFTAAAAVLIILVAVVVAER